MICSMFVNYCLHQWSLKRAILLPWGRKAKEGQKWRKGAITHETCKTFFYLHLVLDGKMDACGREDLCRARERW